MKSIEDGWRRELLKRMRQTGIRRADVARELQVSRQRIDQIVATRLTPENMTRLNVAITRIAEQRASALGYRLVKKRK